MSDQLLWRSPNDGARQTYIDRHDTAFDISPATEAKFVPDKNEDIANELVPHRNTDEVTREITMQPDQSNRYMWLDTARAISAFAVCAGHLRSAAMIDYAQISKPSIFDMLFYFITGLGHQAVIIFFVLSGFFVGGSVLKAGRNLSIQNYLIARLVRLWVVLIPALALTAVVDALLKTYFPEVIFGKMREVWNSGPLNSTYASDLPTFIGNLFFQQTILVPVFGSNDPLWSLANEFWYYLIFPFALTSLGWTGDPSKITRRLVLGFLALGITFWLPATISKYLGIWLLGVISHHLHKIIRHHWIYLLLSACAFFAALATSQISPLHSRFPFYSDILIGVTFAIFCTFLAGHSNQGSPYRIKQVMHPASEMSYSLYLVHFPLVILGAAFFLGSKQMEPGLGGYSAYFLALLFVSMVGFAFWHTFERHTSAIKGLVLRSFISSSTQNGKAKNT